MLTNKRPIMRRIPWSPISPRISVREEATPRRTKQFTLNGRIDRILVALDFSQGCMKAFRYGLEIARQRAASLVVVYVMRPMHANRYWHPLTAFALKLEKQKQIKQRLENLAQKSKFEGPLYVRVVEGSRHDGILKMAAQTQSDLIVLGGTRRQGFRPFIRWSVAERVVRHAKVPVLVIPS